MRKRLTALLLKKLPRHVLKAAGDDLVLQPNELKTWMKSHPNTVRSSWKT